MQKILKTSCYDCHSNITVYPWYAEVQPVGWWLSNHVNEGKRAFNFSEFISYPMGKQYKKLEEINDFIKKDEMPLKSYLIIHKNAILSNQQKLSVAGWVINMRKMIKENYPADNLIRKKNAQH